MPASKERLDYGELGKAQPTQQGGLAVPAHLTRAGVFTYLRDGKPIREWRPMAEVSRPATLDSLKNAPVTVKHPREGKVAPRNFQKNSTGHVGADVRMDGDKTAATVYVQGEEGLRAIGANWREVSCGYNCDTDETPGIVPEGEPDAGQAFDRTQKNILYNHLAIVPHGRAGTARLHLDAADNAIEESMETKKVETISGIEYEVGTPAHVDARTRQDAADKALKDEVARLRADHAEVKGKHDALAAEVEKFRIADKARADAAEREVLVGKGALVLGKEWKADGLTSDQIVTAIIAKVFPEVRLDTVDAAERPAYTKGLLATIGGKDRRNDAAPAPKAKPQPVPFNPAPAGRQRTIAEQYRTDMDDGEACGRPLAISRRKPQQYIEPTMIENRS